MIVFETARDQYTKPISNNYVRIRSLTDLIDGENASIFLFAFFGTILNMKARNCSITMKGSLKRFSLMLLFCITFASVEAQKINYKDFGTSSPGKDSAIVFAPGLISTPTTDERVVAIAPDGSELFFMRIGNQGPRIYSSSYRNGKWQAAALADFSANDIATEPFISPDGTKLFFVSARMETPSPDIWVSERSNNVWAAPKRLGENVNTSAEEEWHPSVSSNGDLYFASTRIGGKGGADLYFSRFENGDYAKSQNMGDDINSSYNDWDPYIHPDGKYIIFKSNRPGGFGGMDMYISVKKDGKWTAPQNLGAPINTADDDDAGDVTPDGKYLIFARGARGAMDVYWINMEALERFITK